MYTYVYIYYNDHTVISMRLPGLRRPRPLRRKASLQIQSYYHYKLIYIYYNDHTFIYIYIYIYGLRRTASAGARARLEG